MQVITFPRPQANAVRPAPPPTLEIDGRVRDRQTGRTGTITGVASCGISRRPLLVTVLLDGAAVPVCRLASLVDPLPADPGFRVLCRLPGGRTLVRTETGGAWIRERAS